MKNARFLFKGHEGDLGKGEVLFHFTLESEEKTIDFTEKISFPPVVSEIPQTLLKSILNNLMLILGISYWKTYCPKEIIIESNFLTYEQANFWNTVYTKGLGEFFYKNNIDFRGRVKFPYVGNVQEKIISFPRIERVLLGLGGGKDSIVAAEILKSQNKPFDVFTVGTSLIQEHVAKIMDKKPFVIMRYLDPKLFELNKTSDVYNGHIPISVIYAFLGLFGAILYDYRFVVVGNEKSANYGNVTYLGEVINHQWSKSEEFENLLREYVKKFITLDISYSSLFRNMNELEVTKEFAKYPKYYRVFSSCNRNFKILKPFGLAQGGQVQAFGSEAQARRDDKRLWCGKCAKCLFVFTLLSVFLPKKKILDIFGNNLFEDKTLLKTFKELLGLENFKPFECVGTPEEMRLSLEKVSKKGEFSKTPLMEFYVKNKKLLLPVSLE